MASPQTSNPEYNDAYCICIKTVSYLQLYTNSFAQLALSDRSCTAFPKHTRKMCHSDPSCLLPVQRNTNCQKSFLSSRTGSLSIRATAHGTLTFADIIKTSNLNPYSVFLCSFDILSLFTNVPLADTIQISDDALYSSKHPPALFARQIFVELMKMATPSVVFSFDDIMYRQIDTVAMGSFLGPALANIFVGYYESKLFQTTSKPEMYYRYMDDTFVVFSNEDECNLFLDTLNLLNPSLSFTFGKYLTWLSLFWTCWLKNFLPSSPLPSTGDPH